MCMRRAGISAKSRKEYAAQYLVYPNLFNQMKHMIKTFRLEGLHPLVCFIYLISILCFTAFAESPIEAAASLLGGLSLAVLSGRARGIGLTAAFSLAAALANFVFVHNGDTVLFFIGDTAYTLEALLYGVRLGVMLAAACLWGMCAVKYVSSDKYIWLLGRLLPSAALVLSCAIRFVPLFIRTAGEFAGLRGEDTVKGRLGAFSATVSYCSEQAMDSALSMRARGYGTARRTSFSVYRFSRGTAAALSAVLLIGGAAAVLKLFGAGGFSYYPRISGLSADAADIAFYICFGLYCLLPSAYIA